MNKSNQKSKNRIVTIPSRMEHLVIDRRGLPVPYVVLIDNANVPRFQINDSEKVAYALEYNLCSICGQPMKSDDQWLVGGPLSAFHSNGGYNDSPIHHECLTYALQMCPYLAGKQAKHIDPAKINMKNFDQSIVGLVNPTVLPDRVPFFVAVQISGRDLLSSGPGSVFIKPHKPYLNVEYWSEGKEIKPHQAEILWRVQIAKQK